MKRVEPQSVGDVLRQAIDDSQMASHLDELHAVGYWPAIVGPEIAEQCMRPYVNAGAVCIRVPDAALRHELSMSRSEIIREFNRIAGKEVIKSVRFTG